MKFTNPDLPLENCVQEYEQVRPLYIQLTKKLKILLADLIATKNIDIHLLESRTKELNSFKDKAFRAAKNYTNPLQEITDLCGIRIITYYQEDSDLIAQLVREEFNIEQSNAVDTSTTPSEFGYKSTHFIVSLSPQRTQLIEWKSFGNLKAEIQIRTVLQHAWSAISHKLHYKREADVPNLHKRKLFRLSALLELADEEFVALKKASSKLNNTIAEQLSAGRTNIEVNYLSVQNFLVKSKVIKKLCDEAEDAGFSFDIPNYEEYEDDPDSLSTLVELLHILKIENLETLETHLKESLLWADTYLKAQFEDDRSGTWYATPGFICYLMLLGIFIHEIRLEELLLSGWDRQIAKRVLDVASNSVKIRKAD